MKTQIKLLLLAFIILSCNTKPSAKKTTFHNNLIGTWQLVSNVIYQKDSVINKDLTGKKMIKIINQTHFSFLNHDVNNGENSSENKEKLFVAGGGTYKLEGQTYKEYLEYCNYREWENHDFIFNLEMKGDTLVQSGIEEIKDLNVSQKIVETYVRVR